MQATFTIRDAITPALKALARKLANPQPILQAMGEAFVSVAKRSFDEPSLRPAPWPPRRGAQTPRPLLKRSSALWRSIRIASVDSRSVTVASDRPYAAIHQLGTGPITIRARLKRALFWPGARHPVRSVRHPGIPARPFFPITPSGQLTPAAHRVIRQAVQAKLRSMLPR